MEKEIQAAPAGSKIIPILVVLLIVASFLIGSLYTQVNFLKKSAGAVTGNGTNTGNNAPAAAAPDAPTAPVGEIDVAGAPALGNKNAKVAVVEFTDFQCPFCGQLFTNTFPSIKKDYIDTGKIKYITRNYPLTAIHPFAQKAAEAANCAQEQNKYWEFHDKMFTNQTALAVDDLKKYAGEVGLNASQFASCVDGGKQANAVSKDQKAGESYGVRGTPASFVGVIDGDKVKNAVQVSGAVPFDQFKSAIEDALKKA